MDLKTFTDKQLKKLLSDIAAEQKSRSKKKMVAAKKAAEAAAKKHGFSLSDFLPSSQASAPKSASKKPAKKTKAPAPAKYKNPADASQTWSGRGRQPAWYKDALAKGKSPSDLAI